MALVPPALRDSTLVGLKFIGLHPTRCGLHVLDFLCARPLPNTVQISNEDTLRATRASPLE